MEDLRKLSSMDSKKGYEANKKITATHLQPIDTRIDKRLREGAY